MDGFLSQATLYLLAMVIAVPISKRLGLGSVLGYLGAGILIGPVFGFVGSEMHDLQHFAEFGVVMMLFLIGLEMEPRALWAMRDKLLGLGGGAGFADDGAGVGHSNGAGARYSGRAGTWDDLLALLNGDRAANAG